MLNITGQWRSIGKLKEGAERYQRMTRAGEKKVSESASKELEKWLEDVGIRIAKEAIDYAMLAGRKTVKAEDMQIATRKILGK